MRRVILAGLLAVAAWGQVQFYTPAGALLSGSYSPPGTFLVGVKQTIQINVQSSQPVCVVLATASGSGFLLETPTPDTPAALAAGSAMTLSLDFTATNLGKTANANVEVQYLPLSQSNGCNGPGIPTTNLTKADLVVVVNGISTGAVVSLQPGGPSVTSIAFGNVQAGQTATIRVYLSNPGSNPITIHVQTPAGSDPPTPVALDSAGAFTLIDGAFPLTLSPSTSAAVDLQFAPPASQPYSAALVLGPLTIPLSGTGAAPPFSTPTIVVDTSLQSGTQPSLSITLPTPAPAAATGTLFLAFKPSAGTVDDPQVQFVLPAGRKIGFSFNAGATVATIGSGPAKSVQFQTGTTAGSITFSATFQTPPQPVTATIAPQPIAIDSTIANIPNDSEATILLNGFDNTKSASQFAFTFYTLQNGKPVVIPPGQVTYDATRDFSQFFATSTAGGMFSFLAQFTVNGQAATTGPGAAVGGAAIIYSVDVQMTNSAGTTTLTQLLFSQCGTALISNNCTTGTGCPCP